MIFYHEIGDEAFRPLNKKGDFLPQRDPLTDAYRPGGRALNYRSEPFGIDEMHLQHEYFGFEDESLAYSAYTFGDPPTTIPRAYLGDPVKWRIVHGGSEVFHSHHPHGGTIRWPRSPRAVDQELWATAKDGPVKYPVVRTKTDRVDVEVIGPSEALDFKKSAAQVSANNWQGLPVPLPCRSPLCGGDVGLRPHLQHAANWAIPHRYHAGYA